MFFQDETIIKYNEQQKNYKYDKYGEPNIEEIQQSMFARKNLIQHGFLVGMRFAGLTDEKLALLDEKGLESFKLELMDALSNIFESHGLTREIEFF